MEEEKRESKEESVAEEREKVHKKNKKEFLWLVPVLIALGIALFFIFRETGVINKHVYEEVENLGEREGVCFDNLLFSYIIRVNCGGQREERWLCILNTGDVYAFEWNNELTPWDWYWMGDEIMNDNELHPRGYDEASWREMENVVYLGRYSDSAVRRLNSYVENFDINEKYYYAEPPQVEVPQGGGGQQERDPMEEEDEEVEWRAYGASLYWHDGYLCDIEWCRMNPTWWGGYEKEIRSRSLDENAIAAIKLFESSGFYDRWVKMCLDGY